MPKRRANHEGSIVQRKDKNGKKLDMWQAQFTDFTGKRRTFYGKTQQEALKKMKEAQGKSDVGVTVDGAKITFAGWMEHWLEVYSKPNISISTYSSYYSLIYNHIVPAFSNILLKDLRLDMLQRFFNSKVVGGRVGKIKDPETGELVVREGGLSIGLLAKIRMLMLLALSVAIENNLILKNVADKVKLPKEKQAEVEILTVEEQKILENAVMNDDRPVSFCILLALYTGLRIGELCALKVEDINLEEKEIYVRRSVKRVVVKGESTKTRIIYSDPKTEKSNRTIPLPVFMVELLEKFIDERNEYAKVIAECLYQDDDSWKDTGYLFITQNGVGQEQNRIRVLFESILKRAGLKHIKFHALRHTFASRCIEAGFDIKSLSDILGHTDVKMTLRVYTHSLQDHKRKNMDKLSPLFKAQAKTKG